MKKDLGRRDWLKSLVTLPVVGGIVYGAYRKKTKETQSRSAILEELGLSGSKTRNKKVIPHPSPVAGEEIIRLGIIGTGHRGRYLMQTMGFAHPDFVNTHAVNGNPNKPDPVLQDFLEKENLNVKITAICDVFELHAKWAMEALLNPVRPDSHDAGKDIDVKVFKNYKELIDSDLVDAVIIATPDFWHAPITLYAARAGLHVYCEKCMTRTEEEAHEVYNVIHNSGVTFQVGHQNRQQESYMKAKELVAENMLGKISLVQTYTNRNTPNGAWIRHTGKPGSPETIDWDLFKGDHTPDVPFSIDRFYNWTKYWAYATGLSGQLFSHEFDAINQILDIGIPESVVSNGGIYFYKDGREIPDVFHTTLNYPGKELVMTYGATLMNSKWRNKLILGQDASMEVGGELHLSPDGNSAQYKNLLDKGLVKANETMYSYKPGSSDLDAVTTATEQYYASRGLIHTYRDGRRYDLAMLHIKEWLDAIRVKSQPTCNIIPGYEDAIACHMATKSYRENRKVFWDKEKRKIV